MYSEDFERPHGQERNAEDVYSKPVRAGKRTYFFDVKTTKGNNDYYLKSLKVKGYGKTPSFNRYKETYRVKVPENVSRVEIVAKAHSSRATVKGDGTVSLKKGENIKYVRVKSSSGKTKRYKLIITRQQ